MLFFSCPSHNQRTIDAENEIVGVPLPNSNRTRFQSWGFLWKIAMGSVPPLTCTARVTTHVRECRGVVRVVVLARTSCTVTVRAGCNRSLIIIKRRFGARVQKKAHVPSQRAPPLRIMSSHVGQGCVNRDVFCLHTWSRSSVCLPKGLPRMRRVQR